MRTSSGVRRAIARRGAVAAAVVLAQRACRIGHVHFRQSIADLLLEQLEAEQRRDRRYFSAIRLTACGCDHAGDKPKSVPRISACVRRMPLGHVGVEQFRRRLALRHGGEFPPEIERVVHAVVHALAADGNVDMARIAGQKGAAFAEPRRQPVAGAKAVEPDRIVELRRTDRRSVAHELLHFLQRRRLLFSGSWSLRAQMMR